MKTSIIIRTKNEERWIAACLSKVFAQTCKNFEVIVVDNCSTDRTLIRAKEFPVKIATIDKFLPGKAINVGINQSDGDYIVVLSGHCIPVSNEWLENLIAPLENENVAGVYGRQEPFSFSSDADKRDLIIAFGLDRRIQTKDPFFHNANSAIRRDVLDKYPFDEHVTNIEDRIWARNVLGQGYQIWYEPSASVYHWHGIHHGRDIDRAKSVVSVLENTKLPHEDDSQRSPTVLAIIPCKLGEESGHILKCVGRTIQQLKSVPHLTKIVAATDSNEIAAFARECGALAPFVRPPELSEAYVDILEIAAYTLGKFEEAGEHYDYAAIFDPFYVLRLPETIDRLIYESLSGNYDSVYAAERQTKSIWKGVDGRFEPIRSLDEVLMPTILKDSEDMVLHVGYCSVIKAENVRLHSPFVGKVTLSPVDNVLELISVKTSEDFKVLQGINSFD